MDGGYCSFLVNEFKALLVYTDADPLLRMTTGIGTFTSLDERRREELFQRLRFFIFPFVREIVARTG